MSTNANLEQAKLNTSIQTTDSDFPRIKDQKCKVTRYLFAQLVIKFAHHDLFTAANVVYALKNKTIIAPGWVLALEKEMLCTSFLSFG